MIGFPKNSTEILNCINKRERAGFLSKNQAKFFLKQGDVYLDQGLPHRKTEGWKHFPFTKILKSNYTFSEEVIGTLPSKSNLSKKEELDTLFVLNGKVQNTLSLKGLSVFNWQDIITEKVKLDPEIKKQIDQSLEKRRNSLCTLNNTLSLNGLVLVIEKDLKKPLEICYIQSLKEKEPEGLNLRNFIFVKEEVKAIILENFYGSKYSQNKNILFSSQTDSFLERRSCLHYIRLDQGERTDVQFNQFFAYLKPKAQLHSVTLSLKSGISRYLTDVCEEEQSQTSLNSLSILNQKQYADHKVIVSHLGEGSKSSQWYQSLLFDSSQYIFNGKIYIAQEAQQSDARQLNKNYLLGEKAQAVSSPELQVLADDVKAFHGASVSSPEENKDIFFYLQSRGLNKAQALNLILSGLIREVFNTLKEDSLKTYLTDFVYSHLRSLKEDS